MTAQARTDRSSGKLEVTVDDEPWATYTATVRPADGRTAVGVAYTTDRRFESRYLPQARLAARYRDDALAARRYAVVVRTPHECLPPAEATVTACDWTGRRRHDPAAPSR